MSTARSESLSTLAGLEAAQEERTRALLGATPTLGESIQSRVLPFALDPSKGSLTPDAAKILAALEKQTSDCDDEGDDAQSIDAMVARFDASPGVKAAIQSAGMTTREYVLFTWSLLQNGLAAWAVDQPGGKLPAGASQANVDFYRKHEAELQSLSKLAPSSDCDEIAEDEG